MDQLKLFIIPGEQPTVSEVNYLQKYEKNWSIFVSRSQSVFHTESPKACPKNYILKKFWVPRK